MAARRKQRSAPLLIISALIGITLVVYAQVGHQPFSMLDDPVYVSYNAHMNAGLTWTNFQWAWTTFDSANWHPITWLSHLLDAEFFGRDPGPQHIVSLAIHIASSVWLFVGLRRLTSAAGPSALVAALFAIHPLNVESVAWIAERKNVLSTLCWWATIGAYVRYVGRPGRARYAVVAALFAIGLMAKPMLVTLPLCLLLMDVWPLERASWPWRAPIASGVGGPTWPVLLREKVPLLVLAAASAVITFIAQRSGGAVVDLGTISLAQRLANAPVAYLRYLEKTVWPEHLSVFYPYPLAIEWTALVVALVILAGISVVAFRLAGRRPFILAGWLWYLVTLTPVIGVIQVGRQAMADRYAYVPLVGIFVAVVWGVRSLTANWRAPALVPALPGVIVVALLTLTARVQASYWEDTERLLQHSVDVMPTNFTALRGLAGLLSRDGRHDDALAMFKRAAAANPGNPDVPTDIANEYAALGLTFAENGQFAKAIEDFREALRVKPGLSGVRVKLGLALLGDQRPAEALAELQAAIAADPADADARYRIASVYIALNRVNDAIAAYQDAPRLNPKLVEAHTDLGRLLLTLRRPDEAIAVFRRALQLDENVEDARLGLGLALASTGHLPEARQELERVLRLNPGNESAKQALAEIVKR